MDNQDTKLVGSANVFINVLLPLTVSELVVPTGETTQSNLAIFRVKNLDFLLSKYSKTVLQELVKCEVYNSAVELIYESDTVLLSNELLTCEARCDSDLAANPSTLDFKLIINLDKSKRVVHAGARQTTNTYHCVAPPSSLQIAPDSPTYFYIDTGLVNQNFISIQGFDLQQSTSQQPTCWFFPQETGGKQVLPLSSKGYVLPKIY